MEDRVKTTQYPANKPCEDTICCAQLKSIDAYTVSIFDGHGGKELSEYCREKINDLIDTYIDANKNTNSGKQTV